MLGILYVDDSQVQLNAFREGLASGPYQVWTVLTQREAEDRMVRFNPDLVIIDYNLSDSAGDAVLRALKPLGSQNTRFYLYTSDATAFRRHREMGFDGVLMLKGKSSVRSQVDAIAKAMTRFRT